MKAYRLCILNSTHTPPRPISINPFQVSFVEPADIANTKSLVVFGPEHSVTIQGSVEMVSDQLEAIANGG